MPVIHLTDLSVRALKGSEKYISYMDDVTRGFGIRVGLNRKTWIVVRGRNRERVTIGRYPDMSLSDARTKAKKLLSTAPEPRGSKITFADARDEFLKDNYRNSTSEWPGIVKLIFKKHFGHLDHKRLAEVTDADISAALDKIEGPSARLHAYRVACTFLRWSTRPPRRYLMHSPMEGYEAPGNDRKGTRILSDAELKAVWSASGEGSRRVFRLLILWGTRSAETTKLRRSWRSEGIVTIPGDFTKNGRDHSVPLLPLATSVLDGSPPSDFYFPGQKEGGSLAPGSLHALRRDIQKETGVTGWGAHDLRRTFRSNMARLKVPRDLCEILLNHAPPVLDSIYDKYSYLDEKRDALAKYEAFMVRLLSRG